MSSHAHQWVFAGEVVIPTSTNEVHGNPFNRLEYCIVCGGFRIKFHSRWRYWYSDVTKKYLDQFNKEEHRVLKTAPPEFRLAPSVREVRRLGRGLGDLLPSTKNWTLNFYRQLKGKPDAKE